MRNIPFTMRTGYTYAKLGLRARLFLLHSIAANTCIIAHRYSPTTWYCHFMRAVCTSSFLCIISLLYGNFRFFSCLHNSKKKTFWFCFFVCCNDDHHWLIGVWLLVTSDNLYDLNDRLKWDRVCIREKKRLCWCWHCSLSVFPIFFLSFVLALERLERVSSFSRMPQDEIINSIFLFFRIIWNQFGGLCKHVHTVW